jgi:dolichol-phosphate mannosyltransferase
MSSKLLISVIIPVFNEEGGINEFYRRLNLTLEILSNYSWEIIFIDDGSEDSSLRQLEILLKYDARLKVISFSRNFGHQKALSAGLNSASGEAIITLDADLQHPPELIPELIQFWNEGYEVVYTVRKDTLGISKFKGLTSSIFYKIIGACSPIKIIPNASDYRLISKKVCSALMAHREREKFYRGMIQWVGFKQKAINFVAEERYSGKSGYTFSRMIRFALEGFLSYSYLPVFIVVGLTFFVIIFLLVYIAYVGMIYFQNKAIPGQTSVLMSVLIVGLASIAATSINSIYIYKIYHETKNRPQYIISKRVGFGDD